MEHTEVNKNIADKGAWVSIVAYLFLSFFKLISGFSFNSEALIADGLNNTTDIVASIAVLIGLKMSRKPADDDHPYGHHRAETIASLVASFIMATVGLQVLLNAGKAFFRSEQITPEPIAALMALFSAIVMLLVYYYNLSLSKKTESHALMAAAKDNLSDALVSIGAVVGILGAQFNLPWLDPLAAIFVGLIIIKTAWDIFSEASHMLSDGFTPEKLEPFKETIQNVPGVLKISDIKARTYGNKVIVDATIEVCPSLSVLVGHQIMDQIEENLKREHKISNTHIHIEPMIGGTK